MQPAFVSDDTLDRIQRDTFRYFQEEVKPANGMVADNTRPESPASIAAIGFALAVYPVGVERGWLAREEALANTLATLRFFRHSRQGTEADATGYKGFYYHFLDMQTGQRVWKCELSTVDTAFMIAGMLAARGYFGRDTAEEEEVRNLADFLYRRVDWQWAQNGRATLTHGWRPESGFLPYRWDGYDESLLMQVLGLGSPTFPLPVESYQAWTHTFEWKQIYGRELLYAGPLFIHQFSHMWIDFRGIQDAFMRSKGSDYSENSRRATLVHQEYAVQNPQGFASYSANCWGLTASDGPGPADMQVEGVARHFEGYLARGAPFGPDDGTIAPWAAIACLPFAPEVVLATIQHFHEFYPEARRDSQFKCSFNPTFPDPKGCRCGWISPDNFGLHEGPVVLMIENYRSGLLWKIMQRCPYLVTGLRRAGFAGGCL